MKACSMPSFLTGSSSPYQTLRVIKMALHRISTSFLDIFGQNCQERYLLGKHPMTDLVVDVVVFNKFFFFCHRCSLGRWSRQRSSLEVTVQNVRIQLNWATDFNSITFVAMKHHETKPNDVQIWQSTGPMPIVGDCRRR